MKIASSMIYDLLKEIKWDFKINTLSMIFMFYQYQFLLELIFMNVWQWILCILFSGGNIIIKKVSTKSQNKNALV